jgi:hypothetical protein
VWTNHQLQSSQVRACGAGTQPAVSVNLICVLMMQGLSGLLLLTWVSGDVLNVTGVLLLHLVRWYCAVRTCPANPQSQT